MRLLVTGGQGFIGCNFIREVMSKSSDYEVLNIDKLGIGSSLDNLKDLQKEKRYRFLRGDILDFELMCREMKEVDAVVNFAAETHVDRSIADPNPFLETNVLGTFRLLEAERKANTSVRHVQISTDEIYGETDKNSFTEKDRLNPSNPYSASKAGADMLCYAYHRTYGMDVLISRCTNNFGPYQFPEKLIPKTIIRAQNNLPIPVYGQGMSIRDWLYVQDHCEAIELILHEGLSGEIYNISSGNEMATRDVVSRILEILGKPKDLARFVEDRPGHDMKYSLDSSKMRETLNWRPRHDFENALRRTVEWYAANDWWWRPLITAEHLHQTPWKSRTSGISTQREIVLPRLDNRDSRAGGKAL